MTYTTARDITDADLRRTIQAARDRCEGFNQFTQWAYFGADTIAEIELYELKDLVPMPVDYGIKFDIRA